MAQKRKRALPPGIAGSVDELASAIGVHRRTMQEWKSKEGFPSWSEGYYNIVKVDRWRNGYAFLEDDNPGSVLDDMDKRTQLLIESLKKLQSELVESLPQGQQAAFAVQLDKAIGNAVKDAFGEGDSAFLYTDFYLADTESD